MKYTHYVAIVPADLRSAGIYYKDLQIRLNTAYLNEKQAQKRNWKWKTLY